jgi:hypothetical protein
MYAGYSGSHADSTEQPAEETLIDPDDSPRLRSPILGISGFVGTHFTVDVGRGSLRGAYAETIPALRNIMPVSSHCALLQLLLRHLNEQGA